MRLIDADDLKCDLLSKGFYPAIVKGAIENAESISVEELKEHISSYVGIWEDDGEFYVPLKAVLNGIDYIVGGRNETN